MELLDRTQCRSWWKAERQTWRLWKWFAKESYAKASLDQRKYNQYCIDEARGRMREAARLRFQQLILERGSAWQQLHFAKRDIDALVTRLRDVEYERDNLKRWHNEAHKLARGKEGEYLSEAIKRMVERIRIADLSARRLEEALHQEAITRQQYARLHQEEIDRLNTLIAELVRQRDAALAEKKHFFARLDERPPETL